MEKWAYRFLKSDCQIDYVCAKNGVSEVIMTGRQARFVNIYFIFLMERPHVTAGEVQGT
jgi:hypothetical protein